MDKLKRKIYINKIIKVMKNDYPLLKNLKDYGFYDDLSEYELNYVLSGVFGETVRYMYGGIINKNGNRIYRETSYGYWVKYEYDENNNRIYNEDSDGFWFKKEYDENRNLIYYETSNGYIEDNR